MTEKFPFRATWWSAPNKGSTKRRRTAEGARDRKALIAQVFGSEAFGRVRAKQRPGMVADDDILDAFAALWTAGRAARGEAHTVPSVPSRDSHGLPMEMVA